MDFAIGDAVVIHSPRPNQGRWAFYLEGSKGYISKKDGTRYYVEFVDVVDARPEIRNSHDYGLDFLVEGSNFYETELLPYDEPFDKGDDGFSEVF